MNRRIFWMGVSVVLFAMSAGVAQAQVYKVVDENGNITYTDQVPPDGRAPMELPELSVIKTDLPKPESAETDTSTDASEEEVPLTRREIRRMYRDFNITRPAQEETFWGTSNSVVISWDSSATIEPEMSVRVFVDGIQQTESNDTAIALTLDRGEHKVYAELLDSRGRNIATTPTVTFFVMQASAG